MNEERYYVSSEYRAKNDTELKNELYRIICPRLELNESRGFNGHAMTQSIMNLIVKEMDEWLEMQNK